MSDTPEASYEAEAKLEADANATATPNAKPPPKDDPETWALRGKPARVIRFRRGLIIGIAAASSAAIMGITWVALMPETLKRLAESQSSDNLVASRPPDGLAGAPKTYADIPRLGPPLPGDLGGPILAHQNGFGAVPITADPSLDQAHQAAEAERQARAAELKAARQAGVLVQTSGTGSGNNGAAAPSQASETALSVGAAPKPSTATSATGDPNRQSNKIEFVNAKDNSSDINPHLLTGPASPFMLSAGSIISASLITGLRSDLPGLVTAQVTENAYDSATGRILLIPQGSRLIGSYDSVVAFGQKRALVVWQRIIMPDGASIQIDNAPASDAQGYVGLADKVDVHTWTLLKGVALSTLLGVGTQLSLGSSESDLVRAIRESTQQNSERAGQQLVGKALDVQPTITVRPGARVRIVVHKDILLRPWVAAGGY